MTPPPARTPAEIVRQLGVYLAGVRGHDVMAEIEAVCSAWDREQERAQETCGTCERWSVTVGHYGECSRTLEHETSTFSCAAWTPKEASDGGQ